MYYKSPLKMVVASTFKPVPIMTKDQPPVVLGFVASIQDATGTHLWEGLEGEIFPLAEDVEERIKDIQPFEFDENKSKYELWIDIRDWAGGLWPAWPG